MNEDITRQYEAIKSLSCVKNHLQKAIFCPASTPIEYPSVIPTPRPMKPTSVTSQVWEKIQSETNPFQLSAIEKVRKQINHNYRSEDFSLQSFCR